jgi:hypothetical protein
MSAAASEAVKGEGGANLLKDRRFLAGKEALKKNNFEQAVSFLGALVALVYVHSATFAPWQLWIIIPGKEGACRCCCDPSFRTIGCPLHMTM